MKRKRWVLWTVIGVALFFVYVGVLSTVGESPEGAPEPQQATPEPQQAKPEVPVTTITAQELYDEREANATRYDAQYLGKTVRVTGQVVKIDDGDVTLGIDTTGFGIDESGFFGVDLRDLSQEEQISLDRGDQVSAVCKVGDYILGTINMEDCALETPEPQQAKPEPQQATPEPQQAKPEVPVTTITAQELYDEREANATRYDAQYLGKTVRVTGQVVKIDDGDVTLGIDTTGFGIDESGLFGVDLGDLSQEEQISLNKGDQVSAVCKVGDYFFGSINMEDCALE